MAIHAKTIEYAFQSSNAELASGGQLLFPAITLYIPETVSRTFRSVILQVYARDTVTTPTTMTAPYLGIKLGAAALDNYLLANPPANSGESQSYMLQRDVTAYFAANFGAGGNQTCQASFTCTGPSTINIGAKLIITYECEDAATRIRTARIPLDSGLSVLTETLTEIGTDQIPALNGFIPEAGKVIRRAWFELWYNENTTGPTNDAKLGMQVDTEAEHQTGIHESSLASSCFGLYLWDQTAAAWVASGGASTHKFKLRSTAITAGSTFNHVGILLCVTYEYDHANSNAVLNSVVLPMMPFGMVCGQVGPKDADFVEYWVEEPGEITQEQSGVLVLFSQTSSVYPTLSLGNGSERQYLDGNLAFCGGSSFTHRADAGAAGGLAWTLARGRNEFWWRMRLNSLANQPSMFGGLLFLNYRSGKHADGDGVHNKSTAWFVSESYYSFVRILGPQQWVNLPEDAYFLNAFGFLLAHLATALNVYVYDLAVESLVGEIGGGNSNFRPQGMIGGWTDAENGFYPACVPIQQWAPSDWRRWTGDPETRRMNVEASRRLRVSTAVGGTQALMFWVTHHSITFEVAGEVRGSKGGTVALKVYQRRAEGDERHVLSGSRVGNGPFSFTWYDDTEPVSVRMYEDAEHHGASKEGVVV